MKCALVLDSYRRTVFYTFETNETDVDEILYPLFNFLREESNKQGDAIIRIIDALEPLIDKEYLDYIKTDCIPAGTYYTFVIKCQHCRIHTYRNNYLDPDIKEIDYFWNAKLLMLSKIC